jgi:hypothetical protein
MGVTEAMSSVLDYLRGRAVPFVVFPDPEAGDAEETAQRHGVDIEEMVRTEVVSNRFGHALMVVPWERRLDITLARRAMNDPGARLAMPDELFGEDPVVITALTNETMKREPVGTRRRNLWAVRPDPEHPALG